MILVDTSVWVAHLRGEAEAAALPSVLEDERVLTHPHVIGELVLGGLANEPRQLLTALPLAPLAEEREVLHLVDENGLAGEGIGWVDAHLLTSVRLVDAALWTLDKALRTAARRLGLSAKLGRPPIAP